MPKKLREELVRALLEATDGGGIGIVDGSSSEPVSFQDLVKDMSLNRQDLKAFAFKTKAMVIYLYNLGISLIYSLVLESLLRFIAC